MARHHDFDAARAEAAREPITFRLGGRDFTCREPLPAGPLLQMAAKTHGTDMEAFDAFCAFLDASISPADLEDFHAVLADPESGIGITQLLELVAWIIGEATGRPLFLPSDSPPVQSEGGEPSRVVSLSPVPGTRSA